MKSLSLSEATAFLPLVEAGNGVATIGGVKAKTKVFYIAGLGTDLAAKNNELIDQATKKENGVTNFDGSNKLNKGRQILVTAIRILFDTTAATPVKEAGWKSEAPAVFKNGTFKVGTSAAGDIIENPVGPFAKYSSSLSVEQEFKQVVPFMIPEEVEYYIQLIPAGNAAADQKYRIEFDAIEFTAANKA
ncbi:hypothetical protein AMR72_16345 [Flavobacterium psychrophilum]|nr:hypothetical protein AMR72_16345 [Flavobacterium psychrophilum]AOE53935.1 hypothetical protein ALW18_16335 [Flavobacterium psychrophilum]